MEESVRFLLTRTHGHKKVWKTDLEWYEPLYFVQVWYFKNHLPLQEVFHSYEKNDPGYMDAANLRQALSSAGYHLNFRILNILVHRYGNKRGKIAFNDFILCAIRLKSMIGKDFVGVVTQHNTTRVIS